MNIGIDLVQVSRFKKLITNKTFINNNFTENEIMYIESRNNNISTIAGLYASKEAFLKSIKKGINNYSLKDIEISHDANNAPFIIIHNQLLNMFRDKKIDLSISHDGDFATAIVIVF